MTFESEPVFQKNGIIDVTRFDVTPENPVIGYLSGGTVFVFSDGNIKILDANDGKEELESFYVRDIIRINANINNYDPDHLTEIALMTQEKSFRIGFEDADAKFEFAETLRSLTRLSE